MLDSTPQPEEAAPPRPVRGPFAVNSQRQRVSQRWVPPAPQRPLVPAEYLVAPPLPPPPDQHRQRFYTADTTTDFVFPLTRHVLWDGTPRGPRRTLTPDSFVPSLVVQPEPLSRVAQCLSSASSAWCERGPIGWLVARLVAGELRVERFDPGVPGSAAPAVLLDGDFPLRVFCNEDVSGALSAESPTCPFVREHIAEVGAAGVAPSVPPLTVRVGAALSRTADTLLLRCVALLPSCVLSLVPISPPRLLPTPFSDSLWQIQHRLHQHSAGVLSLDQSRRVVLLPHTDRRIATTPLVGAWVMSNGAHQGGDAAVESAVWAACCRYLRCVAISDRAFVTPADTALGSKAFLVAVLAPSSPADSAFFQCTFVEGDTQWAKFELSATAPLNTPQIFPLTAAFSREGSCALQRSSSPSSLSRAPVEPQTLSSTSLPSQLPPPQIPQQQLLSQAGFDVGMLQPVIQPLLAQIQSLQAQLANVTQELARQQSLISASMRSTSASSSSSSGGRHRIASDAVSVGVNTSTAPALSRSMLQRPDTRDACVGTSPARAPASEATAMFSTTSARRGAFVAESPAMPQPTPSAWRRATDGSASGVFVTQQPSVFRRDPQPRLSTQPLAWSPQAPSPARAPGGSSSRRRQQQQHQHRSQRHEFDEGDSHIVMPSFLDESFAIPTRF